MQARIEPIEKPNGFFMCIGFFFMKRMFGKVITPAKTIYNRVPEMLFVTKKFADVEAKISLEPILAKLIKHHVASINGCSFCIDINQRAAIDLKIYSEKFKHLHQFETSPLFSEKEKSAFRYVEAVTRQKIVSDELFTNLKQNFNDTEIVEITYLCAMENFYNCMNIPLGIESDNLCALI
ncbi:MAG TPA: carboxymuconolactone decarboxylase family protein [Chitinophagales bacterium]|nr:carboxymuconolactone decarboxylase family protein [Chitinophagales bacterium]